MNFVSSSMWLLVNSKVAQVAFGITGNVRIGQQYAKKVVNNVGKIAFVAMAALSVYGASLQTEGVKTGNFSTYPLGFGLQFLSVVGSAASGALMGLGARGHAHMH